MIITFVWISLTLFFLPSPAHALTRRASWDYAPAGFELPINGKNYHFSSFNTTGHLSDAFAYCESKGMYVVAFDNDADFDVVRQIILLNFDYIPRYWTSGHRMGSSDVWFWSSTKSTFNGDSAFWAPGQPDEFNGRQVCVALDGPDFLWHDYEMGACQWEVKANFLCEAF